MKENHPDKESYIFVWEKVISVEIEIYKNKYAGCIELVPDAEEEIWEKYVYLNNYCKINYMKDNERKLDRHKVAACYMIAILMVAPMRFIHKTDSAESALALNEGLAITVGLSLVSAFAISAVEDNKKLTEDEKGRLKAKFEKGIAFPHGELVNHGEYMANFCSELYYGMLDGKMYILALAHELYLLEVITRMN